MMKALVLLLCLVALTLAQNGQECPPDAPLVNCYADPCSPGVRPPGECPEAARCSAYYCGGCFAHYFDANGNRICTKENTCPEVMCAMYCTYGFKTDENGCDICQCKEPQPCPNGVPYVNCFVDPCSASKEQCPGAARCVSNYCGGCNAEFYDANGNRICKVEETCPAESCGPALGMPNYPCPDGSTGGPTGRCLKRPDSTCGWEIRECPRADCSDVMCEMYCPYGFQTDRTGCEICQCKPAPCKKEDCPQLECPSGTYPAFTPDSECCPKCVPFCDGSTTACPPYVCPEGQHREYAPGDCCGRCVSDDMCALVDCAQVSECPEGFALVQRGCCPVCEPRVDCSLVKCAMPQCLAGFKAIVRPGDCCPTCVPIPDCSRISCAQVAPPSTCPPSASVLTPDLECCPRCQDPEDTCKDIVCSAPFCPRDQWIKRIGQCCYNCPVCQDTTRTRCNWNDDPVCAKGQYNGPDCEEPVPAEDRETSEMNIVVCTRPTCIQFTSQQVKTALANKAQVPPEHLTVEIVGQSDADECCTKYMVTISDEKSNPSIDVNEAKERIASSLSDDPNYQVTAEDNSASKMYAFSCAAVVGLGVALF